MNISTPKENEGKTGNASPTPEPDLACNILAYSETATRAFRTTTDQRAFAPDLGAKMRLVAKEIREKVVA